MAASVAGGLSIKPLVFGFLRVQKGLSKELDFFCAMRKRVQDCFFQTHRKPSEKKTSASKSIERESQYRSSFVFPLVSDATPFSEIAAQDDDEWSDGDERPGRSIFDPENRIRPFFLPPQQRLQHNLQGLFFPLHPNLQRGRQELSFLTWLLDHHRCKKITHLFYRCYY